MLLSLAQTRLSRAPGVAYEYSNLGIQLLGLVIARQAPEKSLRAAIAQRVTEPLGMTHTVFDTASIAGADVSEGFAKSKDTTPATPWRRGAAEASGGLWSTSADLARWVSAQLDAWPPRDGAETGPISRATLREAHTPSFPIGLDAAAEGGKVRASSQAIGLAWHTRQTCQYERLVEHNGSTEGHSATLVFAPERGFGFVILANAANAPLGRLQERLLNAAADALLPREHRPAPQAMELLTKFGASFANCPDDAYEALQGATFRSRIPLKAYQAVCKEFSERHGSCKPGIPQTLDSPFDGLFMLECEKGKIEVRAHVREDAGTYRFDSLRLRSTGFPPSFTHLKAAEAFLGLYERWDAKGFSKAFEVPDGEAEQQKKLAELRRKFDHCRLAGNARFTGTSNGAREATLPLICGPNAAVAELELTLTDAGKIAEYTLKPRRNPNRSRCTEVTAGE